MQWINLIQNHFITFFFSNISLFIFFSFIYLGVLLDPRFQVKYRIFFILFFFYLFIFFFCLININQINHINLILLIKDIFWFTLILNLGFIWHICILDWLYQFFRYYKYHYICFIITRISFVTSLFFPLYLLELITFKYFESCQCNSDYNLVLRFFYYFIRNIIFIQRIILAYFIKTSISYSIFLMGKNESSNYFWTYLSLNKILLLLISLILSYFILGIPRLYIVWVILSLWKLGEILNKIHIYHQDKINSEYNDHKNFLFRIYDNISDELYRYFKDDLSWYILLHYKYLNSPWFFSEFHDFWQYDEKASMWAHGVVLKHPFLYYPPKTLFLIFVRHTMKNHYEWNWETSEDEIVYHMNGLCSYYNMELAKEEFEQLKRILFLRFKKKIKEYQKNKIV